MSITIILYQEINFWFIDFNGMSFSLGQFYAYRYYYSQELYLLFGEYS